jgi:hypothetical protein
MAQERTFETVELECAEQGRAASLLVEWTQSREGRQLVAVQCDNPRFASLVPWECGWTCWDKVAGRGR